MRPTKADFLAWLIRCAPRLATEAIELGLNYLLSERRVRLTVTHDGDGQVARVEVTYAGEQANA
jgi:hypothetical protein